MIIPELDCNYFLLKTLNIWIAFQLRAFDTAMSNGEAGYLNQFAKYENQFE